MRSSRAPQAAWASGRTSTVLAPRRRSVRRASSTYSICDSIMNTIELWPRPVLGPTMKNRFG